MLYLKAINELTWDDVDLFCQKRIPENAYLDYKENFAAHLEKTIAAMANTLGGLIIIGVAEDAENKPVLPVKGIDFERGLSEKIMNIILSNIIQPVFPEIAVCINKVGDKALVIIRIPQSHQTPHAVANNTKVYLRTGNRNNPEILATVEELEWLRDKRKKSQELRQSLIANAEVRFTSLLENKSQVLKDQGKGINYVEKAWLTLFLVPFYPHDALLSPPELNALYPDIKVREYYGTDYGFPMPDKGLGTMVQDGMLLNEVTEAGEAYHTELNCFGLYYYKQNILRHYGTREGKEKKIIRITEIFSRLDEFFDSAIKYYDRLSYRGALMFNMRLNNLRGQPLGRWHPTRADFQPLYCPDEEVNYEKVVQSTNLILEKDALILAITQKIGWAFNWNISKDVKNIIDTYYQQNKPKLR